MNWSRYELNRKILSFEKDGVDVIRVGRDHRESEMERVELINLSDHYLIRGFSKKWKEYADDLLEEYDSSGFTMMDGNSNYVCCLQLFNMTNPEIVLDIIRMLDLEFDIDYKDERSGKSDYKDIHSKVEGLLSRGFRKRSKMSSRDIAEKQESKSDVEERMSKMENAIGQIANAVQSMQQNQQQESQKRSQPQSQTQEVEYNKQPQQNGGRELGRILSIQIGENSKYDETELVMATIQGFTVKDAPWDRSGNSQALFIETDFGEFALSGVPNEGTDTLNWGSNINKWVHLIGNGRSTESLKGKKIPIILNLKTKDGRKYNKLFKLG